MTNTRKPWLILILMLESLCSIAQVFGGNPPSQRWNSIRATKAVIIFPVGMDSTAGRVAQLINRINSRLDSSIGTNRRIVPVVFQPTTTIPNGYVSLAPFRSEFYLTPPANPFDMGALSWTDQLALHEYRHVEQYSNYNRGVARIANWLLGEQGQALVNALTIPDWFFEGDAVYQETHLSQGGRGRLPAFFNSYRSLWDADLHYSYMQLRNGSLKYFIPDHYALGYQLVSYGLERYGENFWKNVTADAAAGRGILYPFQKAVRKYSGQSFRNFSASALAVSAAKLSGKSTSAAGYPPRVINDQNNLLTEPGDRLVQRYTYTRIPAFYLQSGIGFRKIRDRDISLDDYFTYAKQTIAYAAYRPNIRWGWIDYSEIRLLNVQTGRQKEISRKSRYFSPSLAPDADAVVVVHNPVMGTPSLQILDTSGSVRQVVSNIDRLHFFHPVFWRNRIICAAQKSDGRMSLIDINPQNGDYKTLIAWSNHTVGFPSVYEDYLFATLTYKGRDRIIRIDLGTGKAALLQLDSNSSTGEYRPVWSAEKLVTTRFSAGGYTMITRAAGEQVWEAFDLQQLVADSSMLSTSLDGQPNDLANPSVDTFPVAQSYPVTKGLFHLHSWQPYYANPEYSITIFGQNILNTLQTQFYAIYNQNEGFTKTGFAAIYGGWFPYFSASMDYTFNRRALFQNRTIYWNELEAVGGFFIPLNLTRGKNFSYLSFGSNIDYTRPYFRNPEKNILGDRDYLSLEHQLNFSRRAQQARQEYNPKWGQSFAVNFRHAVSRYQAGQLLLRSNLYFPGFFPVHSTVLNLAFHLRDTSNQVRFSNNFPFARGYAAENIRQAAKWGINYQFPIAMPDVGWGQILYLLRIRNNFFFDQALLNDNAIWQNSGWHGYASFGTELYVDTKWWNQLPLAIGLRYSRLLQEDLFGGKGRNRWDLILPVNLIQGPINIKKQLAF